VPKAISGTSSHHNSRPMVAFDWQAIMSFGALTLLAGCQEGHSAHKNLTDEVLARLSSGAK